MNDVARKIALANDALRPGGYLGIQYQKWDDGGVTKDDAGEEASLYGGRKPTVFKTLKGAYENTGLYRMAPEKIILLLDLTLLPVVHPDQDIEKQPGFSEAAFAERQMMLWTRRTEELMRKR